jgi:hypothetical protein
MVTAADTKVSRESVNLEDLLSDRFPEPTEGPGRTTGNAALRDRVASVDVIVPIGHPAVRDGRYRDTRASCAAVAAHALLPPLPPRSTRHRSRRAHPADRQEGRRRSLAKDYPYS